MSDFFDELAIDAKETINSGYYQVFTPKHAVYLSLKKAIQECKRNPVITEIKAASPSLGIIRKSVNASEVALAMAKGGATGISVLTEPKHFQGSLQTLMEVRRTVKLPLLMKDIILNPIQVDTAEQIGANAILLIQALFDRGYGKTSVENMISLAHKRGLEVLLEVHTESEFQYAITTGADMIGINNRDLGTLQTDLNVTKKILEKNALKGLTVVSESGIKTPSDVRFLSECGASAFLIGSSIMLSKDIEEKVTEFVNA
jgi:indole-3-glycerol phosphate synthase